MWSFYELLLKVSWGCRFDPSISFPIFPFAEDASTLRSFAESKSSKGPEDPGQGIFRRRLLKIDNGVITVMGMSLAPMESEAAGQEGVVPWS